MLETIALLCLIFAFVLLLILSKIDLETRLLPNELVTGFLACGIVFHLSMVFSYLSTIDMVLGGFIGLASLYLIRGVSNAFYQQDTLGLGDVKLLGAAGVWLGPQYILIAMTLGALAGILHGLGYALYIKRRSGHMPSLSALSLPAGPGFAIGIVMTAMIAFHDFPSIFARVLE